MTIIEKARAIRAAMTAAGVLLNDEQALTVPLIYPPYEVGKAYAIGDRFRSGVNSVGDPQLYQVLQAHTSAAEWTPDTAVSLYKTIGITNGYPVWSQPYGASDAYNTGDIVSYNGTLYRSKIDGNVWSPDTYPAGWEVYTA